jgi:hypothetical protein
MSPAEVTDSIKVDLVRWEKAVVAAGLARE